MSSSPFKTFIAYSITPPNADAWAEAKMADLKTPDPWGSQWSTLGMFEPFKKEGPVTDLQGAGHLMAVRFNERVLPAKVRNEQVEKAIAKLEKQQGHKASKTDYAQLRDQAEFDLLPKAFIRRSIVPILFRRDVMLVCTSSQRRADLIVQTLITVFGTPLMPRQMRTLHPLLGILTTVAVEGEVSTPDGGTVFYSGNCAVLKGEGKKAIRIKDKAIQDSDVHALVELTKDYAVHELGLWTGGDEDNKHLTFTVNANLLFKQVEMPNVKGGAMKADFFAFAVLCVQTFPQLVLDFLDACGGAKPVEPTTENDDDNYDDDDDL